ncbi:uncharacterized protein LOC126461263 isoform X2 [Schistocerca serialis cubense]|uniref:uncharacterized protein LOC126461263 isoform X2 n=1 Tax=Schistocerca serialis cubense TaxID=2023355 RepID=UPI00214ECB65|nr:uncharacterized protein LOC126461263 isoform X2 [Schistocerca serialis cubense]
MVLSLSMEDVGPKFNAVNYNMLRDSRLFSTVMLLKHLAHLGSALIVSLWCYSSFMKFFNYKETQALPTAGIISQIISTLQYLLLGLLLRSVYEVYRAMIAIYTYFEAELWPTVLLVLECSLLGISLPVLPIHPMIFIMLMWWLCGMDYGRKKSCLKCGQLRERSTP